jgi:hypothetical protein
MTAAEDQRIASDREPDGAGASETFRVRVR